MIAETKLSRPERRRKRARPERIPAWHPVFLRMLPAIRKRAKFAFRHLNPDAREEAVQEVTASATVAFKDLWDRDKAEVAYPSFQARYGLLAAGDRAQRDSPYSRTTRLHIAKMATDAAAATPSSSAPIW